MRASPVIQFKLKLFLGKLKSRWSGPYTVVASTPSRAVTLKTDSGSEVEALPWREHKWILVPDFEEMEEFC